MNKIRDYSGEYIETTKGAVPLLKALDMIKYYPNEDIMLGLYAYAADNGDTYIAKQTRAAQKRASQGYNFGPVASPGNLPIRRKEVERSESATFTKKRSCSRVEKPRVTMTFKRRGQVTDGHLTLIFMRLLKEKWIDGNDADFKALFSGTMDDDCVLTWRGVFGKSTLVELFKQFAATGLIIVPEGFTLPAILEGHFQNEDGERLTGLGKGDKPNAQSLPLIAWCVKMLKADPQNILNGGLDDEGEFISEYDSYDHQDMRYHKHL